MPDYDFRNCQSLFGYAEKVHKRSGGTCQLCDAGTERLDFDQWRQLTVEHLIGRSQGGYLQDITSAFFARYPDMPSEAIKDLARRVDGANTVSACSFCNSTTSRNKVAMSMSEVIANAPDGSPDVIYQHVTSSLAAILEAKRADVAWKLRAVRIQFDSAIAPELERMRVTG